MNLKKNEMVQLYLQFFPDTKKYKVNKMRKEQLFDEIVAHLERA